MKEYIVSVGTAFGWYSFDGQRTQDIGYAKKFKTLDDAWKKALEINAPAVYEIESFATKVIEYGVWKANVIPSIHQMKDDVKRALQTIYEHSEEVNGIMVPVFQEEVAILERALTDTTLETEEERLRECKTCPQYFSNKGFVCPLHYCQHFKAVFGLKAFEQIITEAESTK